MGKRQLPRRTPRPGVSQPNGDTNENVLDGNMCKQFKEDDIRMVEAVHSQEPGHGPKTFFRGQQSIDGI